MNLSSSNKSATSPVKYQFDQDFNNQTAEKRLRNQLEAKHAEELAQAKDAAREEGRQQALNSIESQTMTLLEEMQSSLTDLFNQQKATQSELDHQALNLSMVVAKKLAGHLIQQQPEQVLAQFFDEIFGLIQNEPQVTCYLHPEMHGHFKTIFDEHAVKNGFKGKVELCVNEDLDRSDFEFRWQQGGIKRSTDSILEAIDKCLENYFPENAIESFPPSSVSETNDAVEISSTAAAQTPSQDELNEVGYE